MAGPKSIYLDHAAATPTDKKVLQKMLPFFSDDFYNPSATYIAGQASRRSLETARSTVAHWLGARSSEIIFTAGGTEANNLAIHGVMRQFPGCNVVTSAVEHESVLLPARNYSNQAVSVEPDGTVDMHKLLAAIDDKTVLISIMYANNEVGTIQPIREISKQLDDVRKQRKKQGNDLPLYLHSDACQAANYLDLHVARLGVDLLSLNGGKIYGPKQSGALYVRGGLVLKPLIEGGGQESGLRSGTESIANAVGLAAALEIAQTSRRNETKRLQQLQKSFFEQIAIKLPLAFINGPRRHRLPNNVHLTIPGQDNERLIIQLDAAGIMAAAGSACSASNDQPSHVLEAMGLGQAEARASLRLTMGRDTTSKMVQQTVKQLKLMVK